MTTALHLPEKPHHTRPRPRDLVRALGPRQLADGLIALLFSATGPVALIMAAGHQGGMNGAEISSWIFGVFFCNGILTVLASWIYRTPLAFFWTIPGTVIVGSSLGHLSLSEVVGAYLVTGALITILGVSGLAKWFMELLPLPIVMAMVAGVFLSFGLDLIHSLWDAPLLTVPMAIAFAVLVALPRLGSKIPPVLAAMVVGIVAVTTAGQWNAGDPTLGILATPMLHAPEFTFRAAAELVLPLAITVIVVQNGQGVAVLRGTGHHPPVTASAILSGVWSVLVAPLGAVSSCLTGPTNALIVAGKPADRHWAAAIVTGVGAIVVGILAPAFVGVILRTPAEFLAALAGLAMLVPLCGAFATAFSRVGWFGPLSCFLVTVADQSLFGIGAPFWGVAAGLAVWALIDRRNDAD